MRVRNEVWSLTGRECEAMATGFLIEENNLNSLDDDSRYRLRQAIGLKDEIVDCVTVRAIFNYYDDIAVEEEALVIDGKMFGSQVFKGIDPAQILGAYVFVLTAGDFSCPDKPVAEQVLLDLWGTAFATAGRKRLQAFFAEDGRISETFGPGLYGIPVESMPDLVSLVDAEQIGVTVNESCFLQPVKSYGGIVFRVAEDYKPRGATCATCRGAKLSCRLCECNPKKQEP
ncbi:MAG: hypothetical protein II682_01645 [Firmicutes bacterium]|nr:hypothetical protein [Bacillota bacterium]